MAMGRKFEWASFRHAVFGVTTSADESRLPEHKMPSAAGGAPGQGHARSSERIPRYCYLLFAACVAVLMHLLHFSGGTSSVPSLARVDNARASLAELDMTFSFHVPRLSALTWTHNRKLAENRTTSIEADPRSAPLAKLIDHFLRPWHGLPLHDGDEQPLFSGPLWTDAVRRHAARALGYVSCAALIRVVEGRVFVRQALNDITQWYRAFRLNATVALIQGALRRFPELKHLRAEILYNTCDHPLTSDTSVGGRRGAIMFSNSYSFVNMDIPVPDPMDFAEGYVSTANESAAWDSRVSKGVFLGVPHSFATDEFNFMTHHRLRLKYMAQEYPEVLDVYMRKYSVRLSERLIGKLQADGLEQDAHISDAHKASYKYLVIASGGIHSASVCGAFQSNQLAVIQDMAYGEFFYPALQPGVHFMPVDRSFSELVPRLTWLKEHDDVAERIVLNAASAYDMFCTEDSRQLFWAVLLQRMQTVMGTPESIVPPNTTCGDTIRVSLKGTPGEFPSCTSEQAEKATSQREKQLCHFLCFPSKISEDEDTWYWIGMPE
jgi:hypothetical protein